MKSDFPGRQIPIKLILGLSVLVFGILLLFAWNEHKDDAYNEVKSNILALHSLKIEHINNWVGERKRDINYIRNNATIADLLIRSKGRQDFSSSAEKIVSLLLPMKLNHDYTAMWILNPAGKLVASINEHSIPVDSLILDKTLAMKSYDSIQTAERPQTGGDLRFLLYLYSPILQPGKAEVAGYTIFCIDVDNNLLPIINFLSGFQTDYRNILIHRGMDSLIYTSVYSRDFEVKIRGVDIPQNDELIDVQAMKQPGELITGTSLGNQKVFGLVARVPGTNWYILSTTPQRNIQVQLNEQNITYFLFYLSIFVLVNFFLVLIWFRIERKQEQERRSIYEQYELRLNDAGDIILLTNQKGKIVEANKAALDKYGYTSQQIVEMHFSDIRPPAIRKEVPAKNLEHSAASLLVEEIHRCSDGSVFPAEVITTRLNIRNEWYDQRIIRDISERKRKEWLAKEGEANYQFLVENIKDVPYQLRYDKNEYVYISPVIESLTGYTPDEVRKGNFFFMVRKKILDPKYQISPEHLVQKYVSGEFTSWSADYLIKKKDGSEVWLSDVSKPWVDESGKVIGSIGLLRDITERKIVESEMNRAKQHAEEMNKMKSTFLANMSHELRTPLIGIMGYAEIIQDLSDDEEVRRMSEVIFGSGARLKNTLNMILDLARIEAGKVEINIQPTKIAKLVHEVITLFKGTAEKKGLFVRFESHADYPEVHTDGTLLLHILTNLLNNALKFTNEGGITVTYSEGDIYFSIAVKDTGIGISKKDQEVVWQEFRQASEGLSRSYEGTGLGLAITKSMTEKLAGNISLHSEPGQGSEFVVSIPHLKKKSGL